MVPRTRSGVPIAASAADEARAEAVIARPRIRFGLMSSLSEIVPHPHRSALSESYVRAPQRHASHFLLALRPDCAKKACTRRDPLAHRVSWRASTPPRMPLQRVPRLAFTDPGVG